MQWEILSDLIREQIPNLIIRETVLISKDTSLIEDLEYDSLAIMSLLSALEDKGIDFTQVHDFFLHFNVCGEIYNGICELLVN